MYLLRVAWGLGKFAATAIGRVRYAHQASIAAPVLALVRIKNLQPASVRTAHPA
jgi:hypothetical protein